MNGNACVLRSLRGMRLVLVIGGLAVLAGADRAAAQSADFNSDGVVDPGDASIFIVNFLQFGKTHSTGDADGDTHVAVLCDGSLILRQWSAGPTGSTATVSGVYNQTTSLGSVTVTPSAFGGVSGVYLINTSGTITTGPAFGGTMGLDPTSPPHGYTAPVSARTFWSFPDDSLGSFGVTSTTFTVPAATPVTDLEFFFQRTGQASLPIPILNSTTGQTYVTTARPPCDVPEPAGAVLVGMGVVALGACRRGRGV